MRVALAQDSEKSAEHCNAPMPVSHAAEHSIDMRFEVHRKNSHEPVTGAHRQTNRAQLLTALQQDLSTNTVGSEPRRAPPTVPSARVACCASCASSKRPAGTRTDGAE